MEFIIYHCKEILALSIIITLFYFFKKIKKYITLIKVIRFFYFLFILFAFCIFSYLLIEIFFPTDNTKKDEHSEVLYLSSLAIMTSAFLASLSAILSIMETKENIRNDHKLIEYNNLRQLHYLIFLLKSNLKFLSISEKIKQDKDLLFSQLKEDKKRLEDIYKNLANQEIQIYLSFEIIDSYSLINLNLYNMVILYQTHILGKEKMDLDAFWKSIREIKKRIETLVNKVDKDIELELKLKPLGKI